jgi:hypothetical protein
MMLRCMSPEVARSGGRSDFRFGSRAAMAGGAGEHDGVLFIVGFLFFVALK